MKDFAKIYRMSQKTNYCDNIRFMKGEQIMYKYAYETVSCHLSGYGLGAGTVYIVLMIIGLLLRKELHKAGDMLDMFL